MAFLQLFEMDLIHGILQGFTWCEPSNSLSLDLDRSAVFYGLLPVRNFILVTLKVPKPTSVTVPAFVKSEALIPLRFIFYIVS